MAKLGQLILFFTLTFGITLFKINVIVNAQMRSSLGHLPKEETLEYHSPDDTYPHNATGDNPIDESDEQPNAGDTVENSEEEIEVDDEGVETRELGYGTDWVAIAHSKSKFEINDSPITQQEILEIIKRSVGSGVLMIFLEDKLSLKDFLDCKLDGDPCWGAFLSKAEIFVDVENPSGAYDSLVKNAQHYTYHEVKNINSFLDSPSNCNNGSMYSFRFKKGGNQEDYDENSRYGRWDAHDEAIRKFSTRLSRCNAVRVLMSTPRTVPKLAHVSRNDVVAKRDCGVYFQEHYFELCFRQIGINNGKSENCGTIKLADVTSASMDWDDEDRSGRMLLHTTANSDVELNINEDRFGVRRIQRMSFDGANFSFNAIPTRSDGTMKCEKLDARGVSNHERFPTLVAKGFFFLPSNAIEGRTSETDEICERGQNTNLGGGNEIRSCLFGCLTSCPKQLKKTHGNETSNSTAISFRRLQTTRIWPMAVSAVTVLLI